MKKSAPIKSPSSQILHWGFLAPDLQIKENLIFGCVAVMCFSFFFGSNRLLGSLREANVSLKAIAETLVLIVPCLSAIFRRFVLQIIFFFPI